MQNWKAFVGAVGLLGLAVVAISYYSSSPTPDPSLADCLGSASFEVATEIESDTHGQGELLGVGFHVKAFPELARIDQLDPATARTAAGDPITEVVVRAHGLKGKVVQGGQATVIEGAGWAGATVVGRLHCPNPKQAGRTRPVTLRIADATPQAGTQVDGSSGQVWVHKLEISLDAAHDHLPGCSARPDAAFPIAGYWSDRGAYLADPTSFSFACTDRGAAVCMRWGESYLPGAFGEATVAFQGCARMMHGDYCGDGVSYTREGTLVSWLPRGDNGVPASDDPHHFEAAWGADGAVCIDHPRWADHPPRCDLKPCHTWAEVYGIAGNDWAGIVNGSCLNPVAAPGACVAGSAPVDARPKTGPI